MFTRQGDLENHLPHLDQIREKQCQGRAVLQVIRRDQVQGEGHHHVPCDSLLELVELGKNSPNKMGISMGKTSINLHF